MRKLDQALSGARPRPPEEEEPARAATAPEAAGERDVPAEPASPAGGRAARREAAPQGLEREEPAGEELPRPAGRKGGLELAVQLRQLDWAAASMVQIRRDRQDGFSADRGGVSPVPELSGPGRGSLDLAAWTGTAGGGRFPGAGPAVPAGWSGERSDGQPASGMETDWAERADRAFRRDSRRYDGDFYLY